MKYFTIVIIVVLLIFVGGPMYMLHRISSQPPAIYEVTLSNGEVVKGQVWQENSCTIILLSDGSKISTGEKVQYKRITK